MAQKKEKNPFIHATDSDSKKLKSGTQKKEILQIILGCVECSTRALSNMC
jgi:hypothetical protein